jgi:hypothetical protein
MAILKAALKQLQSQRDDLESNLKRIDAALNVLGSLDGTGRGRGRRGGRRNVSAAGRRRIAAAQKARWAKWKRSQKKA